MSLSIYLKKDPWPQIVCPIQSYRWLASQFLGPASSAEIADVYKVEADGDEGYALDYAHKINCGADPGVYDHGCGIGYVLTLHDGEAQAALTTMLHPYLNDQPNS